jgi:uncharacterized Zn-binding protein involved in type VI secretion
MRPAARLGDKTSHGATPLAPTTPPGGSPNVLIGDRPAWRAWVDVHTCPLASGPLPHVGGVVLMGSASVFINDVPAARMGDTILEVGPPNAIAEGCESVQIGD